jgi:hypothetical protein
MGCIVEAGRRQVHFVFEPSHLRLGKLTTSLGLAISALLLGMGIASRLRARRA